MNWRDSALCAQSDPDAWFPGVGAHDVRKAAKSICQRCPVKEECLALGLRGAGYDVKGKVHGIWGGLSPPELMRHPDWNPDRSFDISDFLDRVILRERGRELGEDYRRTG